MKLPHTLVQSTNNKIALIGLDYVGLHLAVEFCKVRQALEFVTNEVHSTVVTIEAAIYA